ncbi:hypothetical protein [Ramlibacter humi]|uniref:Uncharacterized protein n=1 Tax=Ramlibacter humi TaxID=2530451 RepID=A0A4Z0BY05_9BURK|nr:hypothetical protein [Ramlibacter humi]TFZ03841.1 hypothetical protein EZ216_09325 [Ramlibacter humi]
MIPAAWRDPRRWRAAFAPHSIVLALLAAWFVGLVFAAVQLERWQADLSRTLLQLNADAQFRARVTQRDQVDPQWYRRKAGALLAALDKVRREAWWTVFIPGSWRPFDDLEERVAARMEREFGDIVVETVRRELFLRTAQLTGVPVAPPAGEFRSPVACTPPRLPAGTPPGELPELAALKAYVGSLRELDDAVRAWMALQQSPGPEATQALRGLVRYTLDADLPPGAAHAVALFQASRAPGAAEAVPQWQAAARCAFLRGVDALHERVLSQNELLALEQSLQERARGLFDNRRPEPFVPTVKRLRAVHETLLQEEALLARGNTAWLRGGALPFQPAWEDLLARSRELGLLGPDAAQQARVHSEAAFAQFRRQFDAVLGRGRAGLVWDDVQPGYRLSPERVALREGLGRLLQEPFMQLRADGSAEPPPATFNEVLALADVRRRVRREVIPQLPEFARAPMARVVDDRLALLVHDGAAQALRAALPSDPNGSFDPAAFQGLRQPLAQAQSLLVALGAPDLAQRLASQPAAELGARLARSTQELRTLALFTPRASDFGWWRGEPAPLMRAFGTADEPAMQALLTQQFARVEALARQASQYLAAADTQLSADADVQTWQKLAAETDRWRAHLPDSSMLAMERYLLAMGPPLRRENCAELLMTRLPPRHDDEIAQRLTRMHNALALRCNQLRTEPPVASTGN